MVLVLLDDLAMIAAIAQFKVRWPLVRDGVVDLGVPTPLDVSDPLLHKYPVVRDGFGCDVIRGPSDVEAHAASEDANDNSGGHGREEPREHHGLSRIGWHFLSLAMSGLPQPEQERHCGQERQGATGRRHYAGASEKSQTTKEKARVGCCDYQSDHQNHPR
jgi:hypothetical protein